MRQDLAERGVTRRVATGAETEAEPARRSGRAGRTARGLALPRKAAQRDDNIPNSWLADGVS